MNKGNFLLFFCVGALSAFATVSLWSANILLWLFGALLFASLLAFLAPRKIRRFRFGFLVLSFAFLLASFRYLNNLPPAANFQNFNPSFSGPVWVCENSERDGAFRNLILCNNDGRFIAKTAAYPERRYGDCLLASGRLELPGEINGFRYDRYLAKQGIYFMLRQPVLKNSGDCQSLAGFDSLKTKIFAELYLFRDYLANRINQSLPEPDAGLAVALLLGYTKTIVAPQQTWFSRAGLSHLIAISGSHITLIMALFSRLAFSLRLRRQPALIFSSALAIFYVIFSGAAPSAIRAGVMAFLTFLALFFGRENSAWRALLFAATAMLFINPALLRDDVGFQLSFAAFGGLLLAAPLFRKHRPWWQEAFLVTIVCQLFTWPISSYSFGVVSLVAPLANALAALIFAPLFIALPVAIVFSYFGNYLGLLFFWPAYLLTRYLLTVARLCSSLPFAALNYQISLNFVFVYYFFIVGIFALINFRGK